MKKQLTLETDKRKAKEGEYIDIRWDCPVCPDSLMLIFDSGHKTDKIVVSDSGSTRIAVPKCNGKFIIRLVAGIGGKKATQEVTVRVANNRKAAPVEQRNRLRLWGEKIHAGWCVFRAQMKYWWLQAELQSEIAERFSSSIQTYSNADCFDVPYEDMTDIFITTVATVCRHNNYDTSKIQYLVKELRDHTSIHEGFLTVVESSIRTIIAYEHLKNELICDGYTSEQAENLLPSVDALGRQFQIDEINGSSDFI